MILKEDNVDMYETHIFEFTELQAPLSRNIRSPLFLSSKASLQASTLHNKGYAFVAWSKCCIRLIKEVTSQLVAAFDEVRDGEVATYKDHVFEELHIHAYK